MILIIVASSRVHVDNLITLANRSVWVITALVGIAYVFVYCVRSQRQDFSSISRLSDSTLYAPSFFYDNIGKGALSLHGISSSSLLAQLSEEILLLGVNTRPDCQPKQATVLLSLRNTNKHKVLLSGEQVFLDIVRKEGSSFLEYRFSEQKTPLWVRPIVADRDKICLEAGLFSPSTEIAAFIEEKTQFLLAIQSPAKMQKVGEGYLHHLQEAKCWGNDQFIKEYGGNAYAPIKEKQKVEIPGNNRSTILFLGKGDFLEWKEDGWKSLSQISQSKNNPIAQVVNLSNKEISIKVWDEQGFSPWLVQIERQSPPKSTNLSSLVPSEIRLRNASQVCCSFGQKRFLLKEGDWVLKTAKGWRRLKNGKDIEDFLSHAIEGELFVLDSIEKKQGQAFIQAHLFDAKRVQMQVVTLPVVTEKKGALSEKTKKKNTILQKLSVSSVSKPGESHE